MAGWVAGEEASAEMEGRGVTQVISTKSTIVTIMTVNVHLRTVGEAQYRLFKSTAAKKGVSLSNAFEEAISAWVSSSDRTSEDQVINDMVYRKMKNRLEKEFPGKYAVIADGKFLGAEDSLDDAWAIASPFESAIVTRITKKSSYARIFGSSLRMVGGEKI